MFKIIFATLILLSFSFGPCNAQIEQPITFQWTAPGDDSTVGTCSEYRIAYSQNYEDLYQLDTTLVFDTVVVYINENPVDTVFSMIIIEPVGGTEIEGLPAPEVAGTEQSFTDTLYLNEGVWYFRMWAADEVPNWSEGSPVSIIVVKDNISPSAIIDFEVF